MARYHCRCRNCEVRKVLRKRPDDYTRQPQCNSCGKRDFRIDRWMQKRDTRAMGCTCGGYWFFHRMGSLYCERRKDGTARVPGDADFNNRHYEN